MRPALFRGKNDMYVTVRRYREASELFDELANRQPDIEQLMREVPGFVSYHLFRSGDGGVAIAICQDQAGTEESTRRAAAWVRENVPNVSGRPPEVVQGEMLYQFTA
jgi:hypothetical protein